MQVVRDERELRARRAQLPEPVGFIPTMGALHAGHLSLVERARSECASVVVSIFVNPLQFGPSEDYGRYPRTPERDCELLAAQQVDLTFMPTQAAMYPVSPVVSVDPGDLDKHFEGARRPGHFRGVATVVLKLLHMVTPQRAYFGQKDAQQLAIIQGMVRDLNVPVEIVSCPTVREQDGLALSSRNAYLSPAERSAAARLSTALRGIAERLRAGETDIHDMIAHATRLLPPLEPDYLGVVVPDAFVPLATAPPKSHLLVVGAALAGKTRLIDNIEAQTP